MFSNKAISTYHVFSDILRIFNLQTAESWIIILSDFSSILKFYFSQKKNFGKFNGIPVSQGQYIMSSFTMQFWFDGNIINKLSYTFDGTFIRSVFVTKMNFWFLARSRDPNVMEVAVRSHKDGEWEGIVAEEMKSSLLSGGWPNYRLNFLKWVPWTLLTLI